jgi:hypothetical protein
MNLDDVIIELRELNEPVPIPITLPTENEVDQIERDLNVKFHADFRKYLLEASDVTLGTLEPVTITSDESHTHFPSVFNDAREVGVADDLIPICEDNGNYFCMNGSGEIVYWDHGSINERWPNLATWIKQVWIEENG